MTSPSTDAGLKEGSVLAGKYRVERLIGTGGMGVVVAARHVELGTRVAIKVLRPGVLDADEAFGRFAREARAASRLRSEHVARVFDVGTTQDGLPYMVMEHLVGRDLDDILVKSGSLATDAVVGYVLQACEAVAEAHALGIVHRDLKPKNLFLTRRVDGTPLVKVLDFGIAKQAVAAPGPAPGLTGTLAIVGSPPYMSPEQMRASRDVDARSDVWSLGVCLYELLTGVLPFDGETALEICATAMKEEPRRPDVLRADLALALSDVVMRCLRKDRARRYQDVGELAEALDPFAPPHERGRFVRIAQVLRAPPRDSEALPLRPPSTPDLRSETRTAAAIDTATSPRRQRRVAGIAWVALGAAVAGAVAVVASSPRGRPAAAAPSAAVPTLEPAATPVAPGPAPAAQLKLPPYEVRAGRAARPARAAPSQDPPAAAAATPVPEPAPTAPTTVTASATVAAAPVAPPSEPPFALASAHVQVGSATRTVGTTATNVNRAFAGSAARWTACYRAALPTMSAPFDGAATLHVETDEEGVVVDARLLGPLARALGGCVVAGARGRQVSDVDTGRVSADIPLVFVAR